MTEEERHRVAEADVNRVAEAVANGEGKEWRTHPRVPELQRPALTVTSRTHAMALGIYLMVFLLGWVHLAGLSSLNSMESLLGERGVGIWAAWHFPIGIAAFGGAIYAARSDNPSRGMWVEFVGCAGIAGLKIVYLIALSVQQGFLQGAMTTQILFLTMVLGSLGVMFQIWRQQGQIRRASLDHLLTSETQLAAPEE